MAFSRKFKILAILFLAVLVVGGALLSGGKLENNPETITIWRDRINNIQKKGVLPIIDTHAHMGDGNSVDISYIMESMDELNVALVAFIPDEDLEQGSTVSLKLHQDYPEYFIPTTAGGRTENWNSQGGAFIEKIIDKIEEESRSGKYSFMGEFEIRRSVRESQENHPLRVYRGDVSIPVDSPWVHKIFSIASQTQIPFQMHLDPDDNLLVSLEKMLVQYPDARVIWSHLGIIRDPDRQTMYSPEYIGELLVKFPNLYFHISSTLPGKAYHRLQDSSGSISPKWKSLIEKHSSRFTVGSDIAPEKFEMFPTKIWNYRIILQQLSDSTAENVAYKNAWYLITGIRWGDAIEYEKALQ